LKIRNITQLLRAATITVGHSNATKRIVEEITALIPERRRPLNRLENVA